MKKILLLFVCAGFGSALAMGDEGAAGRFQIISCQTNIQGRETLVIKLDTVTGKTYELFTAQMRIPPGKPSDFLSATGWREIPDSFSEEFNKVKAVVDRLNAANGTGNP